MQLVIADNRCVLPVPGTVLSNQIWAPDILAIRWHTHPLAPTVTFSRCAFIRDYCKPFPASPMPVYIASAAGLAAESGCTIRHRFKVVAVLMASLFSRVSQIARLRPEACMPPTADQMHVAPPIPPVSVDSPVMMRRMMGTLLSTPTLSWPTMMILFVTFCRPWRCTTPWTHLRKNGETDRSPAPWAECPISALWKSCP